jgi:protein TonB
VDREAEVTRILAGSLAVHAIVLALACLVPSPARSSAPPAPPPAVGVIDVTVLPPPPPAAAPAVAPPRAHAQRAPLRRDAAPHGAPVAAGGTEAVGTPDGDGTGDGDAPATEVVPVPVRMKTRPVPIGARHAEIPYTREALEARIDGNVIVELVVDRAGMPTAVHLAHGLGHGLDAIALGLAAQLRFHPALDTLDRPIAASISWSFHFAPPRKDRP